MPASRIVLLAVLAWFASGIQAQENQLRTLTVATKSTPPFVIRDGAQWTGLSIELWRLIEAKLGVNSKFVEQDLETMLTQTAQGKVDIAVAAITVTAERGDALEFSHPFLSSGLGIATRGEERGLVTAVMDRLFSASLLNALLALGGVLAICGVLVWLFERRANEEFGGSNLEGLGSGLWFSAVTMTTVGYGDKSPKTIGGRLVALVWMFASVIIISSYTAAIASALTVERVATTVRGPEDLPAARIGTVRASTASQWLTEKNLRHSSYADIETVMRGLRTGSIDAVVYDAPILRSLAIAEEGQEPVTVLPHVLRRESYAFAMPPDSTLRKSLNSALLEVLESGRWLTLREHYLGR